jgi:glycosyltransferase involved in cell wall biosynthesis
MKTLSIVIPCYNEEEVLPQTAETLSAMLRDMIENNLISADSHIYFVDDGSTDTTWQIIQNLHQSSDIFSGIKLSCNRGHQNAMLAGLLAVPGDITISIDADLQDDVRVIKEMINYHNAGSDIVYSVRSDRNDDSFF